VVPALPATLVLVSPAARMSMSVPLLTVVVTPSLLAPTRLALALAALAPLVTQALALQAAQTSTNAPPALVKTAAPAPTTSTLFHAPA